MASERLTDMHKHSIAMLLAGLTSISFLSACSYGDEIAQSPNAELRPMKELLRHNGSVRHVLFGANNRVITYGAGDTVKISSSVTGKLLGALKPSGLPNSMYASRDGNTLAIGLNTGHVELWDLKTFERQKSIQVTLWSIYAVALSSDGSLLANCRADGPIEIRETDSGKLLRTCGSDGERMSSLAFSDDNSLVASLSRYGACKVWNVKTGQLMNSLRHASSSETGQVLFAPDAHSVVLNSPLEVLFWDPTKKDKCSKIVLPESITPADFRRHRTTPSIDPKILPSISTQSAIIALPRTIVSGNGRVAASMHEGKIYIWDIQNRTILDALTVSDDNPDILALSHRGDQVATGHRLGSIYIAQIQED